MQRISARIGLGFGAVLSLAACAPHPEPHSEVSRDAGAALYAQTCASCHGAEATGNGPLAGDLPIAPPDLTRLAVRNGGAFSHADVMARIHGYPGRFHVMPAFGTLLEGPIVTWRAPDGARRETPRPLVDLATYLASIQEGV